MKTLYIPKNCLTDYIEFPVPDNPDDFWITEVPDDFELKGQRFDPEKKVFGTDSALVQKRLISQREKQKANLITVANGAIAPLQDAVDLDIATDGEKAQLIAWKKYRVLLSRVDTSAASDIEWPEPPAR